MDATASEAPRGEESPRPHGGKAVKPTARLRVSSAMAAIHDTRERRQQVKAMALYHRADKSSDDSEVDVLPKRRKSLGSKPRLGRSRGARRERFGTESVSSLSEVPKCAVATPGSGGTTPKLDLSQSLSWEDDLGSAMDQVDKEEKAAHAIVPSGYHPAPLPGAGARHPSPYGFRAGKSHPSPSAQAVIPSDSPGQAKAPPGLSQPLVTIHQQANILRVDGGERYVPELQRQEATIASLQQELLDHKRVQQANEYYAECRMATAERRHCEILAEHQASAKCVPEEFEQFLETADGCAPNARVRDTTRYDTAGALPGRKGASAG